MSVPRTGNVCVIPGCSSRRDELRTVTIFRFPSKQYFYSKWVLFVQSITNDQTWQPRPNSGICAKHFDERFISNGGQRGSRLLTSALPTIASIPENCNQFTSSSSPSTNERLQPARNLEVQSTEQTMPETEANVQCPNCRHCFHAPSYFVNQGEPSQFKSLARVVTATYSKRKSDNEAVFTPKRPRAARRLFGDDENPLPKSIPGSKLVTPKSRCRLKLEHSYSKSPNSTLSNVTPLRHKLKELQLRAANTKARLKRKLVMVHTLKDKIQKLASITVEQKATLLEQFPSVLSTLITNEKRRKHVKSAKGMRYSDEMKKFAVTLQYYSARAYNFLRTLINLPSPRTITGWMEGHDSGPGINGEIIQVLWKAISDTGNAPLQDVNVMVDEMAIKKGLYWNRSKHQYIGHVDFGAGPIDGDAPIATNALVVAVAGLTGGWRCPVGYIFTDKVDCQQQKTFLNGIFTKLDEIGFNVHCLVADGGTSNVATFNSYGVLESTKAREPITFESITSNFQNPGNPSKSVYAVYDICHLLKLFRGLMAECEEVEWSKGKVDFKYIRLVHELQETEGIFAANNLTPLHIDYTQKKMKVDLAAQVLSRSVADAIRFCRVDLRLKEFWGSEATEEFIYMIDKTFDILNSRHPGQSGQAAPLRLCNFNRTKDFLEYVANEVLKMTYVETRLRRNGTFVRTKKYICQSVRKRSVLGLAITIKSVLSVAEVLLRREASPYHYVLTYRFCQDIIELLFNKIRGRLGSGNNPTAQDFIHIMKRIWHQNLLKSTSTGNCMLVAEGEIPGGLLPLARKRRPFVGVDEDLDSTMLQFDERVDIEKDSPFYVNCLAYVAGVVVRKLKSKVKCEQCRQALESTLQDPLPGQLMKLILRKTNGGLLYPSASTYKIIQMADNVYWNIMRETSGQFGITNLELKIAISVSRNCIGTDLFPSITGHLAVFDTNSEESHFTRLIKTIVETFLRIRFYFYGKRKLLDKPTLRQRLNKTVLFRGE